VFTWKRIQCATLSRGYCVYFCEEEIMCISEKRICVFVNTGYNVYLCEEEIMCFLRRGYSVFSWKRM
jgi:hypothetical protein